MASITKIYHNPRCSKSRQALVLLEQKGEHIEVIKYLEDVPTVKELSEVIKLLKISAIELVRKSETIWKEHFKGRNMSDKEIVEAMVKYPKLIERPIVIKNGKAVIGRPTEAILEII